MVMVEPMLYLRRFVWISKPYVSVVLCYSGFYRSTSLSDVDLTTLTECAVYPRCPLSQFARNWTKETGCLPRRQSNKFNAVLGELFAEPATCLLDIRRKSDRVGLLFRLTNSNRRAEGPSFLFGTIIVFSESVLRNSNSSWRLSLSYRDLVLCNKVERMLVCWRNVGVVQLSGRGLCGSVFGPPHVTESHPVSCICRCREREGGHLPSSIW